jgi:1-phosphofructokinase family hexose kinase
VIVTFTPNPAIDRTVLVEQLEFDTPLRPLTVAELAGGKGINAARAVRALGGLTRCHGAVAGRAGRWMLDALAVEGLDQRFVVDEDAAWQTRTTTVIADETHAVLVYDRGDPIPDSALRRAVVACSEDLTPSTWLVVSGSLPGGDHAAAVAQLLADARERNTPVLVDSSGDGLRLALDRRVDLVKVSSEEAAEVTGHDDPTIAARGLLDGCSRAVVTRGERGAIAATEDGEVLEVQSPAVDARHPAGSGDAFAGALALALTRSMVWPVALRFAAAAGAANTTALGAGALDPAVHAALFGRTAAPLTTAPPSL